MWSGESPSVLSAATALLQQPSRSPPTLQLRHQVKIQYKAEQLKYKVKIQYNAEQFKYKVKIQYNAEQLKYKVKVQLKHRW